VSPAQWRHLAVDHVDVEVRENDVITLRLFQAPASVIIKALAQGPIIAYSTDYSYFKDIFTKFVPNILLANYCTNMQSIELCLLFATSAPELSNCQE